MFLFSPVISAIQDPMYEFYGGLAEVIENNMNSPAGCVEAVKRYIKDNKKLVDKLTAATQRGQKMAQGQDFQNMSEAEMKQKFEQGMSAMSQSKGMEAMNRFLEAFQNFSMKNPDHGEKLGDAIESGLPQKKNPYKGNGY